MPDERSILGLLAATSPNWLAFPAVRPRTITGFALPSETIWSKGVLDVTIWPRGDSAAICETLPRRLPTWCPELHLNADRSFCLGLQPVPIDRIDAARQWWADVEIHLRLLSVALKTRVWPLHSQVDHGHAGKYHQAARQLAKTMDLEEDYARAAVGEPSWISDTALDLIGSNGAQIGVNRPCPCGCATGDGTASARKACPRRKNVARLILLERARRLALADFWHDAVRAGAACCGRLRDCPLAQANPSPPNPLLMAATRRALRKLGFA